MAGLINILFARRNDAAISDRRRINVMPTTSFITGHCKERNRFLRDARKECYFARRNDAAIPDRRRINVIPTTSFIMGQCKERNRLLRDARKESYFARRNDVAIPNPLSTDLFSPQLKTAKNKQIVPKAFLRSQSVNTSSNASALQRSEYKRIE